jgi:hypothetical protein
VVIRKVTKFLPGEATNTSARSIVLNGSGSFWSARQQWYATLVYKHSSSACVKG